MGDTHSYREGNRFGDVGIDVSVWYDRHDRHPRKVLRGTLCQKFHIFTFVNVYSIVYSITDFGINQIKVAVKSIIIKVYANVGLCHIFYYK